jgi:hypothetical protein
MRDGGRPLEKATHRNANVRYHKRQAPNASLNAGLASGLAISG